MSATLSDNRAYLKRFRDYSGVRASVIVWRFQSVTSDS